MLYLLICVLCSVSLSVLLRFWALPKRDLAQVIWTNYIVAAFGVWWFYHDSFHFALPNFSSGMILLLLGVLLPSVFILLSQSLQAAGVAKTDTAQRISLVLPLFMAFTYWQEPLVLSRLICAILGVLALICLLFSGSQNHHSTNKKGQWRYLLTVFFAYGVIDILFKLLSQHNDFKQSLFIVFILAWSFMSVFLLMNKIHLKTKYLLYGVVLGSANGANIVLYLLAHRALAKQPSLVFLIMNLGVLLLSVLIGRLFFGERLNRVNMVGVVLAILAILGLFFFQAA
ncbi:MAG: EamA family transporter [Neisseriaceae bacterium]|nr:EamA family transporter [Neisseriaceae bacterium]